MSEITIRRGARIDAPPAAQMLNAIIASGGTTALTKPLTPEALWSWVGSDPDRSVWHVAELEAEMLGFQWIGPFGGLPPKACEIATFVQQGRTGLGIGSALFEATKPAARNMGYAWIDAEIRTDNEGGLIYYQSRGFRDYKVKRDQRLDDGTAIDKVCKRFDLD